MVHTGYGKPGKSWNFVISFSRPGKSRILVVGHEKPLKSTFKGDFKEKKH